ncbi:MAG TPA: hypothetical protein VMJ52_04720, partial [Xanthobacteraceae bacterium]|nr:hypothetical protein [Xanthobacteraceae bacterium]
SHLQKKSEIPQGGASATAVPSGAERPSIVFPANVAATIGSAALMSEAGKARLNQRHALAPKTLFLCAHASE